MEPAKPEQLALSFRRLSSASGSEKSSAWSSGFGRVDAVPAGVPADGAVLWLPGGERDVVGRPFVDDEAIRAAWASNKAALVAECEGGGAPWVQLLVEARQNVGFVL